jgi:hypothetical protein
MIKESGDVFQVCERCHCVHDEVITAYYCTECGGEYCPLCVPEPDGVCDECQAPAKRG